MTDSILDSVKKVLGIPAGHTEFDQDIILHINSTFATLHQLGIGPVNGFEITDDTTLWSAFLLNDKRFNFVKSYMAKKVRLVFDPPQNSFTITALENSIKEDEFRINVEREYSVWGTIPDETGVMPNPDNLVLDGGSA